MDEELTGMQVVEMFSKFYLMIIGVFFIAYGLYSIFIAKDNTMGSAIGILVGSMGLVLGVFTDFRRKEKAKGEETAVEQGKEDKDGPEPSTEQDGGIEDGKDQGEAA